MLAQPHAVVKNSNERYTKPDHIPDTIRSNMKKYTISIEYCVP